MVKSKDEVIAQFNEHVNMSAEELREWLNDPKSTKAGTGVGIESGHKIVEILKKNPERDSAKYDDEDIEHMRKVVGYNSRHLAQEDRLKTTKTKDELENAKSTISLKNWGHDPTKTLDEDEWASSEPKAVDSDHDGNEKPRPTATNETRGDEDEASTKKSQDKGMAKRKIGEDGRGSSKDDSPANVEAAMETGGYEDEYGLGDADAEKEHERKEPVRKRVKTDSELNNES